VPARAEPVIGMIDAVHKQGLAPNQPILVHCSAGIGRTGTVIGIDHGMQLLRQKGAADTVKIISNLRRCRGGMVQHPEQAEFVNMVLSRFADSNASVATLSVIEDSMQRADQAVPKGFTMHASQVDTDQGSTAEVPSWRLAQLEEKKAMAAEELARLCFCFFFFLRFERGCPLVDYSWRRPCPLKVVHGQLNTAHLFGCTCLIIRCPCRL
jgi:hypothetical protein